MFQADIASNFSAFQGEFTFHLNSEDSYCPDLALINSKAAGGTMAMWRKDLDPYVKILPSTSPAVLPLLLTIPGTAPTAHIGVYLPTWGQDPKFVAALSALEISVQQISEQYLCPIYVRGDCNVNPKNKHRSNIFKHFCQKYFFSSIDFLHASHHHFTGNGASDSQLDLLLYAGPPGQAESFITVVCGLSNPLVNSHHDIVFSSFPLLKQEIEVNTGNVSAPKVPNDRVKIIWRTFQIMSHLCLLAWPD